jgi:hypothetical protein
MVRLGAPSEVIAPHPVSHLFGGWTDGNQFESSLVLGAFSQIVMTVPSGGLCRTIPTFMIVVSCGND